MNRQFETYLSLVYPSSSSWIAICLIPPVSPGGTSTGTDGTRPEHRFTRVEAVSRYLSYARYRNAHGWGIYITPSVLKAEANNRRKGSFETWQQIVYLDCDQPQCLDRIRKRYPFPTLVVRTSRGRHQVYWRLDRAVTVQEQEQLMSAIARDIGGDRAATDVSRVLRLPSFWNRKPNRNNTVDIVFTRRQPVSHESLWQAAGRPAMVWSSACPETSTRGSGVCGWEAFRRGKPSGDGITESERDWYEVHRRLAVGRQPAEVIQWLEQKRRDKRNPRYYAERTVSRAIATRQRVV